MPEEEILQAISQLTNLSALAKEAIVKKMVYFFRADPNSNYLQQVRENPENYSNRIIGMITQRITENKQTIDTEKQRYEEHTILLQARQTEKIQLEQTLEAKKVSIIDLGYFDPSLKATAKKTKLENFLLNYSKENPKPYGIPVDDFGTYSKEQVFTSYGFSKIPDENFWSIIEQYKAIKAELNGFKQKQSLKPVNKNSERSEIFQKTILYQQWFKCLRLGQFSEARKIQDDYKKKFNNKIDFNATDEFGKSPFYYALIHDNAEFMCRLVLNERITMRKEDSAAVSTYRQDIKQAIDTNNWEAFLDARIRKDIENLLRDGSTETLSAIYKRYTDEGFAQVYDGKEFRGKVGDVLKQVLRDVETSFVQYHYGSIEGKLEFYEKAFSALGENFAQIKVKSYELDQFILKNHFDKMIKALDDHETVELGIPPVNLSQKLQSLLLLLQKNNAELSRIKGRFIRLEQAGTYNTLCWTKQQEFDKKITTIFTEKISTASTEERNLFKEVLALNNQSDFFDDTVRKLDDPQAEIDISATRKTPSPSEKSIDISIAQSSSRCSTTQTVVNDSTTEPYQITTEVPAVVVSPSTSVVDAPVSTITSSNSTGVTTASLFGANHRNIAVESRNFLTETLLEEEENLLINKAILINLLAENGNETYTAKRNKGFWSGLSQDGSTTIKKLKELVATTAENKVSLGAIRASITERRKGIVFIANFNDSGTNFVLKKINDAFNIVVNERANKTLNF